MANTFAKYNKENTFKYNAYQNVRKISFSKSIGIQKGIKIVAAKAQLYKDIQVNIIGIDMGSTFDTIQ